MFNPTLIPTFLREILAERTLPREPEPDLVMNDPQQVEAFTAAGKIDGAMAAAYLFHSARISQVIQGCKTVLDLGCGPATQLCQIAGLNPAIQFTGVDLSEKMLDVAQLHARTLDIPNTEFRIGDVTTLKDIPDRSMDAVISTMTLHHLPSIQHLEQCFVTITRILKPGGAIYLTDFGRLKSLKSVIFFAYINAQHQPHIFSLDYERSLRAAFLDKEFKELTLQHLPQHTKLVSTFKVPFLIVIKTEDKLLPSDLLQKVRMMYAALKPRYRRDLDGLRFFLRFGGLENDPFG